MYEITEHTADLGIHVAAPTLESLFSEAARGLFSLLVENLEAIRPQEQLRLEIAGNDPEYLLFDWLNELLFVFETRHVLLNQFDVEFDEKAGVRAVARGETFDPARHRLDHEVKAITYHGLAVQQNEQGWEARVIVDV